MSIFDYFSLFFKYGNVKTEKAIARFMFRHSMTIATVESCTGGLVSSRLTDIPGSSFYIKENYVTYSNEAKKKLLGVSEDTLKNYGAVSEQCAKEMAEGLFAATNCDIALSTTGLAGPDGATETKPIGLMFVGIKTKYTSEVRKVELSPKFERKLMKFLFTQSALKFLLEFLYKKDAEKNIIRSEKFNADKNNPEEDS